MFYQRQSEEPTEPKVEGEEAKECKSDEVHGPKVNKESPTDTLNAEAVDHNSFAFLLKNIKDYKEGMSSEKLDELWEIMDIDHNDRLDEEEAVNFL